ncbi:MAG TPA: response regulator [Steroidobacteraceae bacterium]|nr:response regulator [Steroidobacteraceae bacterium]
MNPYLLVVDDNDLNRQVTVALLNHIGYNAASASSAQEALVAVKSNWFDVILMDCYMPDISGFEAVEMIRAWEKERGRKPVPIVAMSASAFTEDRERCVKVGMNDFLAKPITKAMMEKTVKQWLEVRQSQHLEAKHIRLPEDFFDQQQFKELQSTAGTMLPYVLAEFREDAAREITLMEEAVAHRNYSLLSERTRLLQEIGACIGAKELLRSCHDMEGQLRNPEEQSIRARFTQIQASFENTIKAVARAMVR